MPRFLGLALVVVAFLVLDVISVGDAVAVNNAAVVDTVVADDNDVAVAAHPCQVAHGRRRLAFIQLSLLFC